MTLSLSQFADLFRVEHVRFSLEWQQERSAAGGGETLYADRAPARWMADVTTEPFPWSEAHMLMARLNSLGGGLGTVLLNNPRACYPKSDPGGVLFGAATPVVGTIADRLHAAFTGFPAGYELPAGTFIQIVFGTSRYYLGQLNAARTASGAGAVASVELTPALPASVASGNAVTVIKPAMKARITPNTAFPVQASANRARIQFSAEQTYSQ